MRFRERDQSSIRSYQRISLGKRRRLIQMVNEEGIPISKASKKLKIKLTTARLILKKYNETGEFPMRNFRKKTKPTVEPLIKKEVQEEERQQNLPQNKEEIPGQVPVKKEEEPVPSYTLVSEVQPVTFYGPFWGPQIFPWGY